MLRRAKADVLKDLPPKIIQDYYCELSPLQKLLYEDFAKSKAKRSIDSSLTENDPMKDERHEKISHIFQVKNLINLSEHSLKNCSQKGDGAYEATQPEIFNKVCTFFN